MALSFKWLIDPIPPAAFFSDFYERAPLLIERQDAARYRSLLSIDAIDRLLATTSPCFPDVFLVSAERDIKPEEYSFSNSSPAGRIDLPRFYQLFGAGASMSLTALHERLPELAALCRAAEQTFSSHFQTNIYLSPPSSQGFKTHYDSHDVFVLQVSGSKHWTLYDTLIELPLHGQGFEPDQHAAGPPTREFTLKAGDLLYCPRGLFHSARATDETSLHVTLGLMGKTWADIMIEAVCAACLASPAFRANLPVGFAKPGFDSRQAAATFRSLVETFARTAELEPILERIAEDFVATRRPDLYGCLDELDNAPAISAESRLAPRPDLIYLEREDGEKLVIIFGSTEITLPSYTREPVKFALRGPSFLVRELPGDLDEAGKIVLARRLVREGLLVRRGNGAEGGSARPD
jgi:hypothetical protein